jgi:hypothetical protein
MQRSVALLAAAVTAGLLALTPCKGLAQDFSVANAINNRGDFAGGSLLDSQAQFDAYIVSHGKSFDIGTFGGPASLAFAINELGETVGQSDTSETDTNGDAISLAFLVDRKGVHNLGTLPGFKHSQAFSINNAGLVAGWSYNLDPVISGRDLLGFRAFVYRGGRMTAIGDLVGEAALPSASTISAPWSAGRACRTASSMPFSSSAAQCSISARLGEAGAPLAPSICAGRRSAIQEQPAACAMPHCSISAGSSTWERLGEQQALRTTLTRGARSSARRRQQAATPALFSMIGAG